MSRRRATLPISEEVEGPATDVAAIVEPGRTSALAALRYRDFRLFWFGLLVSNTGTWMQQFGLGYLVVQLAIRDGVPQLAPLYIGLVGLARAVPGLVLGLVGGAVADRRERRGLLLVTQTSSGIIALVLATLTVSDHINVVEVLMLGALNSVIFTFDAPTRHSMVPRLVDEEHLVSAIGLNAAAFTTPQIIGPVLGGLLYLPLGIGGLFFVNALSYGAVIVALLLMSPSPNAESAGDRTVLAAIREGLGSVRRDTVVLWTVILSAAAALLGRPYLQLMPAVAAQTLHVGAVELSWLFGASGFGALSGAIVVASLGGFRRRGLLLIGGALALAMFVALFSQQRMLAAAIVLAVGAGFSSQVFLVLTNTILQTRTPDGLIGRVMSVQTMIAIGLLPLGQLLVGSLGTFVGLDVALLSGGVALGAVALYAAVRVKPLREVAVIAGARARRGRR